ncbi:MAG: hypothetical protein LBJ25_07850 [Candidatus Margulisbacteria bacterium]|jgi:hypothetical protein|nr:hypothetical protein [Candidatus Margulisiibacteriota bacterium]
MTIATGKPMLASDILNLTFFPKGAILTFSSTAWGATSAEFKNIWKVCNKANHDADLFVPDLTDKFLRGAESSDFTTALGADSQRVPLTSAHLPEHKHEVKALPVGSLVTSGLSIDTGGGHTHTGTGTTNPGSGGHAHGVSGSTGNPSNTLTCDTPYFQMDYGRKTSNNTSGIITSTTQVHGSTDGNNGSDTCASFHIDATHSHDITGSTPDNSGIHAHEVAVSIPEGGSHSHTIGGSITGGSVSGNTESAGVVSPALTFSTVPAYYKVMYIIKVV